MKKKIKQTYDAKVSILGGKAFIYRSTRSGDAWQFRYWVKSEKKYIRLSLKTDDRSAAVELAEKKFAETLGRVYSGEKIFSLKAQELYDLYFLHMEKRYAAGLIKKSFIQTLKSHLKHYVEFLGAETRIASIKSEHFLEFLSWRRKNSTALLISIRNTQQYIKSMYRWGLEQGHVDFKKLPKFSELRLSKREGKRQGMTIHEYRKIVAVSMKWHEKGVDERDVYERRSLHNFIVIQGWTGMRTCEGLGLQWKDIKLEDGIARISIREETTKRGKGRNNEIARGDIFQRILKHSKFTAQTDHVFSSFLEGKRWRVASFYKKWRDLVLAVKARYADFDTTKSLYDLRHLFISNRLRAGDSQWEIARFCGTSAIQISAHYDNVTDEQVSRKIMSKKLKFKGDRVIVEERKEGEND